MKKMTVQITQGLKPEAYYDQSVYDQELQLIFARTWQLAGLASELAKHNDFLTVQVAGKDIVVQNFDGKIKAFLNVCAHRHARLHEKSCGNNPLRCPYHGWAYNSEGVPVGIPGNKPFFNFDRQEKASLALTSVDVAVRGPLVFVRVEKGGPSLDEWLGTCGPHLDEMAPLFADLFDRDEAVWHANWKVAVESTLEGYHIPYVHKTSFSPMLEGGDEPAEQADLVLDEDSRLIELGHHSYGIAPLSDDGRASIGRYVSRLGLQKSTHYKGYDHFFLFPNMTVLISGGTVVGAQIYEPMGPEATHLRFWMLLPPSTKPAQRASAAGHAVEQKLTEFNDLVLEEDRIISESVQKGKHQTHRPAVLGTNERRIALFHNEWRKVI
ncbi:Rieske 2Fe-2S domain-containing protein [Acetobacter lambici]|nr:Rieske 2Fe-2S domain-containing protein [Acetobacter lambici]